MLDKKIREELENKYKTLETDELILIASANEDEYEAETIALAKAELKRRGVPENGAAQISISQNPEVFDSFSKSSTAKTKKCSFCQKDIPESSNFCGYCGQGIVLESRETSKEPSAKKESIPSPQATEKEPKSVRPWVRFWARQFDYATFALVFAFASVFIYPEILKMQQIGFSLLIAFLWAFVEPFLLSTWGTTPGKWFCRVFVRDANDKKLTYSVALGRSINVWVRGVGFGIPIVSTITGIVAYNKLTANGQTTWDAEGGFKVTHRKIGVIRTIIFIVLIAGYYILTYGSGNE